MCFWWGAGIEEMVSIQVPVLDKKADRGYRIEKQPLLLPHQIMAYIFDEAGLELCRDEVRKFLGRCP